MIYSVWLVLENFSKPLNYNGADSFLGQNVKTGKNILKFNQSKLGHLNLYLEKLVEQKL